MEETFSLFASYKWFSAKCCLMDKRRHKEARALLFPEHRVPNGGNECPGQEPGRQAPATKWWVKCKTTTDKCGGQPNTFAKQHFFLPLVTSFPPALLGGYFLGSSLSGGIETPFIIEWKSGIKGLKCLGMKPKRESKRAILSHCSKRAASCPCLFMLRLRL